MIDVIKCIFSVKYSPPDIEKAYNTYIYISDYEEDTEHIFDLDYNYICTVKEIENFFGDICGGWDKEREEFIILFKTKILIKLMSRPMYKDNKRQEIIADVASDDYGKQEVIIDKNGKITYIEPEYDDDF